jgi:hypothetical protein
MDKVEKETNKIIQKLSKTEENIKEKLNLPPYHFIELCIIFINYCDELTISKDDFLIAHSQITKDEEEEEASNEEFCTKIFNIISDNKPTAPIHALFAYLKLISITEKINTEILFKILDREEKGNIEFDNVETLISNLEEYLDIKEDWNDFIESFKGKKLTMRNLSQGDFINRITDLFDQASQKINDLATKSVEKYAEEEKDKEKDTDNDNIKLKLNTNSNKDEERKSKSKNSDKNKDMSESSSNISSSKLISKKTERLNQNENENNIDNNNNNNMNNNNNNNNNSNNNNNNEKVQNNQAIIPYDSTNNNDNNINNNGINLDEVNFDDSLFEKIFDRRKELKIHQIKTTSLLYDITLEEFLLDFQKFENTFFDKNKFINTFCEIIQEKTSDVFKGPMLRYSLSLLYQFIDVEKKNKLSYYEILGPVIVLTKAKSEERLNMIFSYTSPELISIISGILSLYLNSEVIKDFNILSEIFIKTCSQMDLKKSQNIFKWIFGNKDEDNNIDKNFDFLVEEDNIEDDNNKLVVNGNLMKQLNTMFEKTKFGGVNHFSIIDITNKLLLKYSLLGQMNMHHLNSLIDDLLNSKYGEQKSKEKVRARAEFLNFIAKYINFGKTELVDVTLLHSLFILIFSGSTMEKIRSIFIIHDINESDLLKCFDLGIYLAHMFHFLLTEMGFEDNNLSNYLGKHIVDSISQGKDGVSFMQIMDFFENIDFDIPSY